MSSSSSGGGGAGTGAGNVSVLRDLAVDFINSAKSAKDSKTKLFQLEQLREIILHRQKDLLHEFINDIFDFMLDKSVVIRKFLISMSGELLDQDLGNSLLCVSQVLNMYQFLLSDSNDGVLAAMSKELSKNYGKIVMVICSGSMGSSGGMSGSENIDVKQLWQSFRAITGKLKDYVASARSDWLRKQSLHIIESELLFGIPNTTTSVDPRLSRKDPRLMRVAQKDGSGGATSSTAQVTTLTAEAIPAHHPLLSKNEIQKDSEELFSKAMLWSTR